tara:strand:+ start:62 stop:313 length:252 start_codon:yes stop_codon:yes gene_type:complete
VIVLILILKNILIGLVVMIVIETFLPAPVSIFIKKVVVVISFGSVKIVKRNLIVKDLIEIITLAVNTGVIIVKQLLIKTISVI